MYTLKKYSPNVGVEASHFNRLPRALTSAYYAKDMALFEEALVKALPPHPKEQAKLTNLAALFACDKMLMRSDDLPYQAIQVCFKHCPKISMMQMGKMMNMAAACGAMKTLDFLLDKGASVGETHAGNPLSYAIWGGHADIVQRLIDRGADPNEGSAWFGALKTPSLHLLPQLLSAGASASARSDMGGNALHHFVGNYVEDDKDQFIRVLDTLIEMGVDLFAANHNGETPYDLISRSYNDHIKAWFNAYIVNLEADEIDKNTPHAPSSAKRVRL